jgi:WD40 repeat protein
VSALAFSPDGSLLAVGAGPRAWVWKVDGSVAARLATERQAVWGIRFLPDGRHVVALLRTNQTGDAAGDAVTAWALP